MSKHSVIQFDLFYFLLNDAIEVTCYFFSLHNNGKTFCSVDKTVAALLFDAVNLGRLLTIGVTLHRFTVLVSLFLTDGHYMYVRCLQPAARGPPAAFGRVLCCPGKVFHKIQCVMNIKA